MKANDIVVGGKYNAKVSGKLTTVLVTAIRESGKITGFTRYYDVTNLATGRKITFRSAAKFRNLAGDPSGAVVARIATSDRTRQPRASGCEFCIPTTGDPFTNRPRGETWTCPYCNTEYTGKETS